MFYLILFGILAVVTAVVMGIRALVNNYFRYAMVLRRICRVLWLIILAVLGILFLICVIF